MVPRADLVVRGKSCNLPGFEIQTYQPVASRYTDHGTPASDLKANLYFFINL